MLRLAALALGGFALAAGCGGSGKPSTPPPANVSFTPASGAFPGTQAVGGTSAPIEFTVKNDSQGTLNMIGLTINGADATQFKIVTSACTGNLLRAGTCKAQVVFAPTSAGAKTANLEFAAGASKKSLGLTGTGVRTAALTVMPPSHNFGVQVVGTESPTHTFIVKNEGGSEAAAPTVVAPPEFPVKMNGCTGPIAANAMCEIKVAFAPTSMGARTGSLAVSSTDVTFRVDLSGTGADKPTLVANPSSVPFGNVVVGKTSEVKNVMLMNATQVAVMGLTFNTTNAAFKVGANTCTGGMVAAGATCMVALTFAPTAAGMVGGELSITIGNGMATGVPLTGNGLRPATLELSSTTVAFGSVAVNTDSAKVTLTLANTGDEDATMVAVAAAGANASLFKVTNNCGATLRAGTSGMTGSTCTIDIVYHPTAVGASEATVNVTSANGGNPSAALTGMGVMSALTLTPMTQDFGIVPVGSTSSPFEFTVRNTGTATTGPLAFTTGADYEVVAGGTDACVAMTTTLMGGGTCKITLRFKPATGGQKTSNLTVMSEPGGSISSVLTGIARQGAKLDLTPPTQAFGSVSVGQMSNEVAFTVTNSGDEASTAPTITSSSAQFTIGSNGCQNNTLDPNEACTFQVRFVPAVVGESTGMLTVTAGAATDTSTVSGVGTAPADIHFQNGSGMNLSVLDFADTVLGQQTASITVFVRNTGIAATGMLMTTLAGTDPGDFVIVNGSNTCGAPLAAGAVCSMQLVFKPTAAGARQGKVTVMALTTGGITELLLNGTGISQVQILSEVPPGSSTFTRVPTFDFGDRSAGTVTPRTFKIKANNAATGTYAITLNGGGAPPNFVRVAGGTCASTPMLPAGGECTFVVEFQPQLPTGAKMGGITVTTSDNRTDTIALTGTATGPLQFTPNPHNFGSLSTDGSALQDFTLRNNNAAQPVTGLVVTIAGDGDFSIAENLCGATLAASTDCIVRVRFLAGATGSKMATLTANGSFMAGGSPTATMATATMTGAVTKAARISVTPSPHDYTTVAVGAASVTQTFTVTNDADAPMTGGVTLNFGGIPADFMMTRDGCLNSDNVTRRPLGPGQSCTFDVRFAPTATGLRSGTFLVSASPGGVVSVQVKGTGAPTLSIAPATRNFDIKCTAPDMGSPFQNVVGQTTQRCPFVVTNNGTAAVTGLAISLDGGDDTYFQIFAAANMPCTGTLAGGASCNVEVAMATPASPAPGSKVSRLKAATAVATTTAFSDLTGTLLADAVLAFTDASPREFGGVVVNAASATHTVTVRNSGGVTAGPMTIMVPTGFRRMPTSGAGICDAGTTLAPNTTCDIPLQFVPTAAGAANGNLTAWVTGLGSASASALSPLTKALTGTGLAAAGISLTPSPVVFEGAGPGAPTSIDKVVTLNNGTGAMLTGVTVTAPPGAVGYSLGTNTCGATVSAGTTCSITVRFQPAGGATPGLAIDTLAVSANAGALTANAALIGTVLAPAALRIDAPNEGADWGEQPVNIAATKRAFLIRNIGGVATGGAAVPAISGSEFVIAPGDNMCSAALNPNATCAVLVTLTPSATGARSATFNATAPGATAATTVNLAAEGVNPSVIQVVSIGGTATTATTVPFGTKAVLSQTNVDVVIRNAPAAQRINTPTFTLTDQVNFAFDTNAGVANDCFDRIADGLTGGEDCNLRVIFRPQSAATPGALSTTLVVGGATTNLTLTLQGTSTSALTITGTGAFANTAVNATSADAVFTIANSADAGTPTTGPVSVNITGTNAGDYRIKANTCTGSPGLAAGASCQVTVVFEPKSTGMKNATVTATASPTNGATVALTGTGT